MLHAEAPAWSAQNSDDDFVENLKVCIRNPFRRHFGILTQSDGRSVDQKSLNNAFFKSGGNRAEQGNEKIAYRSKIRITEIAYGSEIQITQTAYRSKMQIVQIAYLTEIQIA